MPYVEDDEQIEPNDPNMEFDESQVNPFDPNIPPFWINDWRVEDRDDY